MTVEEYRQRMIDAFHKAECDELIALVVMPTEKEFEQLEELLKTHYKKQPCEDCVSRDDVLKALREVSLTAENELELEFVAKQVITNLPSVTPKQTEWIPVSERLPEDLEPVNITWVNHEPEPYYHDIKDKNFVATGIYYRNQWYWYSTTCADYLGEYGSNEVDKVDDAVEIVAWMPLPEPYKEGESE